MQALPNTDPEAVVNLSDLDETRRLFSLVEDAPLPFPKDNATEVFELADNTFLVRLSSAEGIESQSVVVLNSETSVGHFIGAQLGHMPDAILLIEYGLEAPKHRSNFDEQDWERIEESMAAALSEVFSLNVDPGIVEDLCDYVSTASPHAARLRTAFENGDVELALKMISMSPDLRVSTELT